MNREIKFRAWVGYGKMEYRVVAGALGAFYVEGLDPKDSASMSPFNTIYSKETPVMQFIGLLDKNGKEIYEGDVVKYKSQSGFACGWEDGTDFDPSGAKESIGEVKYCNGEFSPREKSHIVEDGYYSWKLFDFEIIGNIYENPELL